jgi:Replication-relaxation
MNELTNLDELLNPTEQFLGYDAMDGSPFHLPIAEMLERNMEIIGATGEGKTDIGVELRRSLGFSKSPYIVYDYADTGFDQALVWEAAVAHFLWNAVELPYRELDPSVIGITEQWIGRHAYATVGVKNPPIRINPFRRVRFPDGTIESPEECAGRNDRVWAAQLPDDISKRVQFRLYLRAIGGILSAAGDRPISEYPLLFEDAGYRNKCEEWQHEHGTFDDPFIHRQWELVRAVDISKREGRDEVHSLRNAIEPLVSGVLAEFFGAENFALEDVIYGDKRLYVSVSGLTSSESKKFAMRMIWSMADTMIAKRRFMDNNPLGVEFIDEIPWLMPDFFDVIARRRNHRWSSVIIRQTESAQFDLMGLRSARDILRQTTGCGISYGAENEAAAREYALQIAEVHDDEFIEALVSAVNASQSSGSSLSDAISTSVTDSRSLTNGTAHSVSVDSDGKKTVTDTDSSSSTSGTATSEGATKTRGVNYNVSAGESVTFQKYRISREEQIGRATMDILRSPRHRAVVRAESGTQLVDMARARQLTQTVRDELVLDYIDVNELLHARNGTLLAAPNDDRAISDSPREGADVIDVPSNPEPEMPRGVPTAASTRGTPCSDGRAAPAPVMQTKPDSAIRTIAALEAVAQVRLCTVQQFMMLQDAGYDRASRELDSYVSAGFVARIKRFAPRGEGSVPVTYILTAAGARLLGEHGHDAEELQRIAKNLAAHRRALEDNLPTQDRHRSCASMLLTILICAARRIDPKAIVTEIRFDRERSITVDLAAFDQDIPERERLLISPDPTKSTVAYVPDFSFVLRWTIDGKRVSEAFFAEVETGFGERNAKDLAIGKAWKLRGLQRLFDAGFKMGDHTFEPGAMPRVVVWSRTAALEQGFFDGARAVYKDALSPLWFTNGDLLPLAIPRRTQKKDIGPAVRKLVDNVQTKVWRWLRFPDPNNRRRFVGIKRTS